MDRDEWLEDECQEDTINGTEQEASQTKVNLIGTKININGEQITQQTEV